jgi:hypothetical protein
MKKGSSTKERAAQEEGAEKAPEKALPGCLGLSWLTRFESQAKSKFSTTEDAAAASSVLESIDIGGSLPTVTSRNENGKDI